jgi:hypothetical protein
MLNFFNKFVVYLDPETLNYMYLNYIKTRNYPVMTKLYSLLKDSYQSDLVVVPLSYDHISHYINDNKINADFLNMMGGIGQIQYLQRFTVRSLQLIRVINSFFEQNYKKPLWKDAFSSDPEEKNKQSFNNYLSIGVKSVQDAMERERNNSMIYYFINNFKNEKNIDEIAKEYYLMQWESLFDVIKPYLPINGSPGTHMKMFLDYDGIKEIPEFQILTNLLLLILESYDIKIIESGEKDNLLIATEVMAAYMPYCHFYITTGEIAEVATMKDINSLYHVSIYDNNESSLYRFINDFSASVKIKKQDLSQKGKSIFKRDL